MENLQFTDNYDNSFLNEHFAKIISEQINKCYQCGKCTAGCPVAFAMDNPPRLIIRLLQLGYEQEALKSKSVWLCSTCETCSARCPKGVDIPRVMEAVRILAKNAGIVSEKNINLFNDLFLKSVERTGRINEALLMMRFNIFSIQPFKDILAGGKLFINGKLPLFPHGIEKPGEMQQLFARVREKEKGGGF